MADFSRDAIKKGLKAVANNSTANRLANKAIKDYANKSDNEIVKTLANNSTVNRLANQAVRSIANNPKTVDIAADLIEKKIKK